MIGQLQLERLWTNLLALGTRRLVALGLIGTTVFATIAFGSFYLSRPSMETLYAGLNQQDVGRIGSALQDAGIPFDVSPEGDKVVVPLGYTSRARMLLAERGLPSNANAGYELFDKMGAIGLTSFMQEVTRTRVLEGEIARTIQAMKGVRAARVHIVLPDQGSFRRNRQPPSASVVIRTESAGDGTMSQAIRHLVSAAVPGMAAEQVRVLTTDGIVLASGDDSITAAPGKMVDLEKTVAKELQSNIRRTLAPYLGMDNFEISVAARLNMDKRQINETAFDPDSKVERSVRVVKEAGSSQNSANRTAVGVEQNVPEEEPATDAADQNKRSNERREELTNFELNTKTTATVSEGYRIDSLTVAVVMNRKRLAAALGTAPTPEAIEAQIKEVERLVGSAAGIDPRRGDRITVAAVDFLEDGLLEPAPSMSIADVLLRQTGNVINVFGIIAMSVLMIWFGLRPATRLLLDPPAVPQMATSGGALAGSPEAEEAARLEAAAVGAQIEDQSGRGPVASQKRLEELIDKDEAQAAAILKQWMKA